MNYFNERFTSIPIKLNKAEELVLSREIKAADEKRLVFFSLVSIIISIGLLILDFFYFNEAHQFYYFVSDSIFFGFSLFVFISSLFDNNKIRILKTVRGLVLLVYPYFILSWATIIAVAEQHSPLNILAFYVALFVLTFFLYTTFQRIILSFFWVLIIYSLIMFFEHEPFFNETLFMIVAGYIATTPFGIHFKNTRYNSHAAHIKIRGVNQNLEEEVNSRIKEQIKLNQDLELEIAQRKMVEIQLRETLKRAEENDRLKSEFLANISHEIRTPLNAIVGFSQMIIDENIPNEKRKSFKDLIEINTFYLLSVIDDVFDASLIQSEQLKTIEKLFMVNEFIRNLHPDAESCNNKYERRELTLKWHFADSDHFSLISDEFLLRKAMVRLIDNAFKFSHHGVIEIGVNIMEKTVEFFVTDTGIGIPDDEKEKIFLPFVQGDGSFTRGYGGSGLGLAIVKGISDALHCRLMVISEVNKGSCFSMVFDRENVTDL